MRPLLTVLLLTLSAAVSAGEAPEMKLRWTAVATPFAKAYEMENFAGVLRTSLEPASPQPVGEWHASLELTIAGATRFCWRFFPERPADAATLDTGLIRSGVASAGLRLRIAAGEEREPELTPADTRLCLFTPEMFSQQIEARIGHVVCKEPKRCVFDVELLFHPVPLFFNGRLLMLAPQGGETLTVGTVEARFE